MPLNVLTADRNLTAVIWTPPLNADVEFVAGRHVGSQRHTLVVDVLFVSYPNLTECARRDLKTQKQSHKFHRTLLIIISQAIVKIFFIVSSSSPLESSLVITFAGIRYIV